MRQLDTYFVIKSTKRNDAGDLRLTGQFILNGGTQIDIPSDSNSNEEQRKVPSIRLNIPALSELKWILPPKPIEGSASYDSLKGNYDAMQEIVENAGFETVCHEDFSYPDFG